jgi:DNA-3-methyladenine glycosylase I
MNTNNCTWPANDSLMIDYHNNEWAVPLHDDKKLFEFLVLDAFQAGLSWKTILHKRENFRLLFDGFDPEKIALFDENKVQQLLLDTSIIRNQSKIRATITNAKAFLNIQKEFGSFDKYIWQFTNGNTLTNYPKINAEIACNSAESDAMSKDLIKRGFKFVGSTICYAFMQAAGMVNDHLEGCSCK